MPRAMKAPGPSPTTGVRRRGAPSGGLDTANAGSQATAPGASPGGSLLAGTPVGGAAGNRLCTTVDEVNISLELVKIDRSVFGSDNDPAIVAGHDPIPRNMILGDGSSSPPVWLKSLFTHPGTSQLIAMDSQSRFFLEGEKAYLRLQDQRCQTPYCDSPIREYDHIKASAAGGTTSTDNG